MNAVMSLSAQAARVRGYTECRREEALESMSAFSTKTVAVYYEDVHDDSCEIFCGSDTL
jgi:hypothetical protein